MAFFPLPIKINIHAWPSLLYTLMFELGEKARVVYLVYLQLYIHNILLYLPNTTNATFMCLSNEDRIAEDGTIF